MAADDADNTMHGEDPIHDPRAFAMMTPLARFERLHQFFVPDAVLGLLHVAGTPHLEELVRPEWHADASGLALRLTTGEISLRQARDELFDRHPIGVLVRIHLAVESIVRCEEDFQDLVVDRDDPGRCLQVALDAFANARSELQDGESDPA